MFDLTNVNIVVLLFVLVISGNFIGELLPCRIQHQLQNNMILKHFIGILTLSFFVILSLSDYSKISNIRKLGISLLLYLFFLAFAKTHYKIWFITLLILTVIYILNLIKQDINNDKYVILNHLDKKGNVNLIDKTNNTLSIFSFIFVICGVIIYYLEKRKEYKKKFSFITFFSGKTPCKHNKVYKIFSL